MARKVRDDNGSSDFLQIANQLPEFTMEFEDQLEFLPFRLGHQAGDIKSGPVLQEIFDHGFRVAVAPSVQYAASRRMDAIQWRGQESDVGAGGEV